MFTCSYSSGNSLSMLCFKTSSSTLRAVLSADADGNDNEEMLVLKLDIAAVTTGFEGDASNDAV